MMNSEELSELLDEYRRQREINQQEEKHRQDIAVARCPEIGRVMDTRRETVFEGVRMMFTGKLLFDIESRIDGFNSRIEKLLIDNGFPQDYLDPVYRCPICRDTAYTGETVKSLCSCVQQRYAELIARESQFERDQTFERYDVNIYPAKPLQGTDITQRAYMCSLRDRCEEYANTLPCPRTYNLLFHGSSGLGKTYMLRSIYIRARDRGVPALCVTANAFLKIVREAYFTREQKQIDILFEIPLLLIDDLGTEPMLENITVEQLFNLLNERQNAKLPTIISTNLTLNELKARYTERILSRLMDARVCQMLEFKGEDVRRRRSKESVT